MGTPLAPATPSAPLPAAPVLTLVDDTAEDEDDDPIDILMRDYDPADTVATRPRGCRVYDPDDTARTSIGSVALTPAQAGAVLEIITEARDYIGTGDTGTTALYGDGPAPFPRPWCIPWHRLWPLVRLHRVTVSGSQTVHPMTSH